MSGGGSSRRGGSSGGLRRGGSRGRNSPHAAIRPNAGARASTARLQGARTANPGTHAEANRRLFWIAFWTGVGFMGALDAIAFHHLLRWHNFFIHAGQDWRAISDGLLHVVTTGLLFAGVIRLWRSRHLLHGGRASPYALAAGIWLGMGVFQFLDGTLVHKVLRFHPVREGVVDILPYDLAWIASSILLMAVGLVLLRRVE